jgi:hypothetical protein
VVLIGTDATGPTVGTGLARYLKMGNAQLLVAKCVIIIDLKKSVSIESKRHSTPQAQACQII